MLVDTSLCAYSLQDACVFFRLGEAWDVFSNMHPDFPVYWAGEYWKSTEALYQAQRYPHLPDLQAHIRTAQDGFLAKAIARQHIEESRPDWEAVRVRIMYECIQTKYQQHSQKLNPLLAVVRFKPIVEQSEKDDFWGAIATADKLQLVGANVLGKLWARLILNCLY